MPIMQFATVLNGAGRAIANNRFSRTSAVGVGGVPAAPIHRGVPRAPSERRRRFARNPDGSLMLFTNDAAGQFIQLPAGSKAGKLHREGTAVFGLVQVPLGEGGAVGATTGNRNFFVRIIPSPRRMNPFNFRALTRAERRIDKFEKTLKRFFRCETGKRLKPRKKRMVRRKKKSKR